MKKLGLGLLTVITALGLVFSGCAAPKQQPPTQPTPERPAPTSPLTPTPTTLSREQQLVEAAKKEGGLSIWAFDFTVRDNLILKAFAQRYPDIKASVWDSRGADILARLSEETKAGQHNVDVLVLSSEIADAYAMGFLGQYEYPNVAGWPAQPTHNYYRMIGGTARVIVYNTNVVSPADVPRTWDDLKSTKWAGKTFISTSGEDSPLFWAYLWREGDKLNWDKSFAYWTEVIKNTRPKVVSGFGGPRGLLAAGEAALMIPDATSGVLRLMAQGAPIAIAPLGAVSGDGTHLALVKDAPHPNSARLFIDWLTSGEGALVYSNVTANLALKPELASRAVTNLQFKQLGMTWQPMPKEAMTVENLKKSSDFWMKALGVK